MSLDREIAPAPRPSPAARHAAGDVVSGADMIWETLVREGVQVVFGYPGGMIVPTYDALPRYPVRHVLVRHEQGAAHMADGYARASGKVGVAIATSGPGATNLVTGIANAMMDSVPMVCITGQVPSHLLGSDAFQETDITGITTPITKESFLVTRAEDIVPCLRQAFEIARSGRPGPVLVDITKDAQIDKARLVWSEPRRAPHPGDPSEAEILAALRLIASAERPLVLAGHGIVQANACELLVRFAERAGVPVACTLLGLAAMPGDHPLCLGMMGMHGEAWVNEAIQRADLLVALGMRFDDRVTGKLATYSPRSKKIHVDRDRSELGKNVHVDVAIASDVARVLERLAERAATATRGAWMAEIRASIHRARARDIKHVPDDKRFFAAHAIHDLCKATRGEATVVTDVGQHQMWAAQYYRPKGPRRFITSGGLGTMGFALPAAIGARFARPDEEIWVIAGDGGFQMTACELATLAQERIKIDVLIINNGHLGMVRQWQELFHGRRYVATPLSGPDFVTLAAAHGIEAIRVDRRSDARAAVARARRSPRPVLLDCHVEPLDLVYPMVPTGADLDDMIRRPAPRPRRALLTAVEG